MSTIFWFDHDNNDKFKRILTFNKKLYFPRLKDYSKIDEDYILSLKKLYLYFLEEIDKDLKLDISLKEKIIDEIKNISFKKEGFNINLIYQTLKTLENLIYKLEDDFWSSYFKEDFISQLIFCVFLNDLEKINKDYNIKNIVKNYKFSDESVINILTALEYLKNKNTLNKDENIKEIFNFIQKNSLALAIYEAEIETFYLVKKE